MPANLTPDYEKADLRYRQAATQEERIRALEEMLAAIPKHKGTEKMQADLKRKLSQLRKEEQKTSHTHGPNPFHVPHSGAGQVVLIGPPNTGKSSLLACTTHAEPKIADYPFTTSVPLPGMWEREDVQIELVDTPPLTHDHVPPGLMGTIRRADLLGLVIEAGETALDQAETILDLLGARGLSVKSIPIHLLPTNDTSIMSGLIIANKTDSTSSENVQALQSLYYHEKRGSGSLSVVPISVRLEQGLEVLFEALWRLLGRIRVYTKQPGRPPDLHRPFVVPAGATVADVARQIHRDLPERMKFARLWGHSRFEGQQVHKTEALRDRDVVEIHE
jgi:uncharacterized protein